MDYRARTIADGFAFPEGPRWHGGLFWFSDQHNRKVHALQPDGAVVEEFDVAGQPSGLGWLPNGDMLVVSMLERVLYRRHAGALKRHADLAPLHPCQSNDMVVDRAGRAYVGNIGFDFEHGAEPASTCIALVEPDGAISIAASDLMCPNGTVITPDGKTLIVGESMGRRLTAFDIGADGKLTNRRLFADLGEHVPDGICLDSEGCVWVASPYASAVIRVRPGGDIADRVPVENGNPYACMLGGESGEILFICCAPHHDRKETLAAMGGRIDVARAPAPRAGWP
jgi:sugar lactone lactonase YvrE